MIMNLMEIGLNYFDNPEAMRSKGGRGRAFLPTENKFLNFSFVKTEASLRPSDEFTINIRRNGRSSRI